MVGFWTSWSACDRSPSICAMSQPARQQGRMIYGGSCGCETIAGGGEATYM